MVILHKITWQEFEKIIQTLKEYLKGTRHKQAEETITSINKALTLFSKVNNQHYNIKVDNLKEKEFRIVGRIINMWNVAKDNKIPYDKEYDVISSKLRRAYFKTFNKTLFPNE